MRHLSLTFMAWLAMLCLDCQSQKEARLIVRGDDIGSTHAANLGCIKSYPEGMMQSVGTMVACAWFPEAVQMLNENPGLDAGVHTILTSERENMNWRPLTHATSITDEDGYFFPMIWFNDRFPENRTQKGADHESIEAPGKKEYLPKPNVIIIYADDLGYGDVGAYGATAVKTPNIDRLARGGIRFTNGHASSATCSPSRYALLTGVYPWRNVNAKILPGTAPLIIDTSEMTLPKMFRDQGYHTGVVGKWHLGLGEGQVDWNQHISPGPNEVGFDYAYIMAATQDRVPTVYIENGQVVGLDPDDPIEISYQENFPGEPTGKDNPEMLKLKWHHGHFNSIVNGISRIGFMKGGASAKWVDENMADTFLVKAQEYIITHKGEPFFLYYALQQPHVPRTPHPRFTGATSLGARGDAIVEADWCIGELIRTLESEGLMENSLIILSSDNGPVLNDGYVDDSETRAGTHTPAGPLRGGKYSLFEAGTRVPFITCWKGRIEPSVSEALVSQMDLLSSLASLLGSQVRSTDGIAMPEVFMGQEDQGREELVLEATSRTAFRKGDWVMIPPYAGPAIEKNVNIELGNAGEFQLYNLREDLGQKNNLADSNQDKLREMIAAFEAIRGKNHGTLQELELK